MGSGGKSDVFLLLLVGLALILFGCAQNRLVALHEDPEIAKIAKGLKPIRYRVVLTPVKVGFDRQAVNRETEEQHSVEIDPDKFQEAMARALREVSLFERVRNIKGGEREKSPEEILLNAWDHYDDLILEFTVKKYLNYYGGINGWFIPNIFIWGYGWVPSWWVADERYGGEIAVEAKFVSAHSNREIYKREFAAKVVRDLDDFERGWMLLGIFRVPVFAALGPDNWRRINEVVMPFAVRKVQKKLLADVSEDFSGLSGSAAFAQRMRKCLALVVGLSHYEDYYFHNIKFSARDARAFHDFLVDPRGGGIPKKNVRLLLNEHASLTNVREALKGFLARRARSKDTVIVYFAGYGGIEQGRSGRFDKYIIPYDARGRDLAKSALSLAELIRSLRDIKARDVILIVDGSFSGNPKGRSYFFRKKGEVVAPPKKSVPDVLEVATQPNVSVLLSGAETQVAAEIEEIRHGLFTFFLLQGLGGQADANKDDDITVAEMAAYLASKVPMRAALEGLEQTPVVAGKKRKTAFLRERPGKIPIQLPEHASPTEDAKGKPVPPPAK
jgi:hypothetical protein